jgi:uncharacterized membrane protein HdeD (DUF308 family)
VTDWAAKSRDARGDAAAAGAIWWVFILTGSLWLLFSIVVFRFDWTTVSSLSILFGVVMLFAAVTELMAFFTAEGGWWKLLRLGLAIVFGILAIVSFVHPGDTFAALAAVMSFYFIVKGIFDIVLSLATWHEAEHAWLTLVIGIVEIGVGFWAAGDFGNAVILLVVWVGVTALLRGVSEIILAFTLRGAAKAAG